MKKYRFMLIPVLTIQLYAIYYFYRYGYYTIYKIQPQFIDVYFSSIVEKNLLIAGAILSVFIITGIILEIGKLHKAFTILVIIIMGFFISLFILKGYIVSLILILIVTCIIKSTNISGILTYVNYDKKRFFNILKIWLLAVFISGILPFFVGIETGLIQENILVVKPISQENYYAVFGEYENKLIVKEISSVNLLDKNTSLLYKENYLKDEFYIIEYEPIMKFDKWKITKLNYFDLLGIKSSK